MNNRQQCSAFKFITGSAIALLFVMMGCNSTRQVKGGNHSEAVLVSEVTKDWLKYSVYRMPGQQTKSSKKSPVQFSIRVINMAANVSPLRRLCTNLDVYNILYEYLLNQTKDNIYMTDRTRHISYPVMYSFENNYDAFPFETINVGYMKGKRQKTGQLIFIDRVFAKDTLVFPVRF